MVQDGNGECSCVIFDFGGVISYPQKGEFFVTLGRRLGADAEVLREAYRSCREAYDRGSLDGPQYWQKVLGRARAGPGQVDIDELIDLDTASWTAINRPVLQVVRRLASSGYRLGLLSNMPADMGRHIKGRFPWLARLFAVVTFSCEIGVVKPEHEIYRHTLARLGLAAGRCLFVDDTAANVGAAREVGMSAVHFRTVVDIRRALARPPTRGR